MIDAHAELSPLQAYQAVLGFAARRGETALRLALHAALPQVLRPELLHLLRLNFLPEAPDHRTAEADVLFAPFCAALGNGYYRFDRNARQHLLTQLDPAYAEEPVLRSRQVADFLLAWCQRQEQTPSAGEDPLYAAFLDVERWVALAFADPHTAAQQLALAVREVSEAGPVAARLRLGGLAAALSTPLAGYGKLLAYAAGLDALNLGDAAKARDFLEPLGNQELKVGEIVLRSPQGLLEQILPREPPRRRSPLRDKGSEAGNASPQPPRAAETAPLQAPTGTFDLFVSCTAGEAMAVASLIAHLAARLGNLLGRPARIWRDERLLLAKRVDDSIVQAIRSSRVFLAIVSKAYVDSEQCQQELQAYLEVPQRSGPPEIFPVETMPTERHRWHPALSDRISLRLWNPSTEGEGWRPVPDPAFGNDDVNYWEKLNRLARDIAAVLREPTAQAGSGEPASRRDSKPALRIYVASTVNDLKDYREAMLTALRGKGHLVLGMEDPMTSSVGLALDSLKHGIADCDAMVVLLGWRYGFVPDEGEGLSITHLEYRVARSLGKPVLVFLSDEEAPWKRQGFDPKIEGAHFPIEGFREELGHNHTVAYFISPTDLALKLERALSRWPAMDSAEPRTDGPAYPPEVQSLLEELARFATDHRRRLEIGDRLAERGDPRPGVGLRSNGVPDLLWLAVPGGTIALEGSGEPFEVPPFHIAAYPVTWCQYQVFLEDPQGYRAPAWWSGMPGTRGTGTQRWPGANRPAESLSWYEAVAYSRWLSSRLGYPVRLPTEWEWQQAATGGKSGFRFPWGSEETASRANTSEAGLQQTTAVGMFPHGASPVGAWDMAGNVWEWCLNQYHDPRRTDTEGEDWRVIRGGSWSDLLVSARCAGRDQFDFGPDFRHSHLGFRLVRVGSPAA